jgi:hypothetical protein
VLCGCTWRKETQGRYLVRLFFTSTAKRMRLRRIARWIVLWNCVFWNVEFGYSSAEDFYDYKCSHECTESESRKIREKREAIK